MNILYIVFFVLVYYRITSNSYGKISRIRITLRTVLCTLNLMISIFTHVYYVAHCYKSIDNRKYKTM